MKKRLFSMLLCMVMLVGVFPTGLFSLPVSAAETITVNAVYDSEMQSATATWNEISGAAKYEYLLLNTTASSDAEWLQCDGTTTKSVTSSYEALNGTFSGAFSSYGNGGSKYKIGVVAYDENGNEIANGYSNVFEPNIPMLSKPSSVTLNNVY